jgi:negative regulator of flagellin synthesis FlgM
MVDSIGTQGVTAQDRLVVPVTPTAQTAATTAKPSEAAPKELALTTLAADFGKPSAAEEARVDEVRRAVRDGTYPITPETIADRMLALKLYWSPKK